MTCPDRFETDRLIHERLSPDHLDDLVALHLDPDVMRNLGGVRSAENTADYLETNLDHWDRHGFGLWVQRTRTGAFAGRAGLRHVEVEGAPELEIAYTLTKPLWGQGLATETAHALVALWRRERLSPSLLGIVDVEHTASRKVMQKIGLTYERDAAYHGSQVALYRMASSAS